jgi:pimeloyl-ACP methyl ester carboxylesterase
MTAVTEGTYEHRGFEHAYEIHGEGEHTVVYMHGLLMDRQMNIGLAAALAKNGYRVVLLDLLGHGRSDTPLRASEYRMDAYAGDTIALLDHLGIDQAVIGGVSLGAGVSLQVAVHHPERVSGLIFEMPVLEWAVPAAAMFFTPFLLTMHYAATPAGWVAAGARRIPRTSNGALDSVLSLVSNAPEVTKAILHGILTGPVAPTVEQRREIDRPALVIGHGRDLIHPFSDAENLAGVLRRGQLLNARTMLELRVTPARLTAAIVQFLDEVHSPKTRHGPTIAAAAGRSR